MSLEERIIEAEKTYSQSKHTKSYYIGYLANLREKEEKIRQQISEITRETSRAQQFIKDLEHIEESCKHILTLMRSEMNK